MSGISRVDPALPAGNVVVRALLGGFQEPATGATVELVVVDGDQVLASFSGVADGQGRVTFAELAPFVGKVAKIKAVLGGIEVHSRPVALVAEGGSRLLLVKPAGAGDVAVPPADSRAEGLPPPAQPNAPHGGVPPSDMPAQHGSGHGAGHGEAGSAVAPALCKPNELDDQPAGTVIIGAIDFAAGGQLQSRAGVEVELFVRSPGSTEPLRLVATTNAEGRATFSGLSEKYPAGTTYWAQTQPSEPEAIPPPPPSQAYGDPKVLPGELAVRLTKVKGTRLVSQPFELASKGVVVLLTRTCTKVDNEPLENVLVDLVGQSKLGEKRTTRLVSANDGVARFPADPNAAGQLYWIIATYQGAPFRSALFRRPTGEGAAVDLRLYDVTSDPKVALSAVQYEVLGREADLAQVNRRYEVMISGTKAYWRPGGLRLSTHGQVKSLQVMPNAEDWLDHGEEEPFATLSQPIPPGPPVDLSLAYMMPISSNGELEIEWTPPFPVVKGLVITQSPVELAHGGQGKPQISNHAEPGSQPVAMHELHLEPLKADACAADDVACPQALAGNDGVTIHFAVHGLPHLSPLPRYFGIGVAVLFGLGLVGVLATHRRKSVAERLLARRNELERHVLAREGEVPSEWILELDQVNRQLDALQHSSGQGSV